MMEYLYFLLSLIGVFLVTKWCYYNKGVDDGVKERTEEIGQSLRSSADWFNKSKHPAMVGNTLYEIGCQFIAYHTFRVEKVRDLVERQGGHRYHKNTHNYTKPTKNGL